MSEDARHDTALDHAVTCTYCGGPDVEWRASNATIGRAVYWCQDCRERFLVEVDYS